MATNLPRLNVTVTLEQHALLLELARLEGRSAASYLRQLLDQTQPVWEALLAVRRAAAEQAATTPELVQQAIRTALLEIENGKSQLDLLDHISSVQPRIANDPASREAPAPSVAREDRPAPRRTRRARA